MSRFLLFRVDNRLVHGQVCTVWIPENLVKRVVIIHDEYAKDDFLIKLHKNVVPKGVQCDTISSEQAIEEWNRDQFGEENTIVLFQDVKTALKLYKMGLVYNELQVATLAGTKDSVCIYKQVNVSPENARIMLEIIDHGVDMYCQMYSSEPRVQVKELLYQKKTKAKLKL